MGKMQKNFWEEIKKPLIYLAPMSGVTNKPYRQMVKKYHSDILFPEFVSSYALHYGSERTEKMLEFDDMERPIVGQLFGAEPDLFYEGAKKLLDLGFDGVDLNFGCPAPKVAKNGGGCMLLSDLGLSREVIQATLDAVEGKIPVSVKTRSSYRDVNILDFCKVIEDMPLAALCVHGRSFEKPYVGAASLDPIKDAKQAVPFLVIASGHAHTPEAAKETLDYTGADGVALARGTYGKPWIGKQIKDYLETGTYHEPSTSEMLDAMLEHARMAYNLIPERPFFEMRKVMSWYVKGIPHAADYRRQLVRVSSLEEVEVIIAEIKKNLANEPDA